MSSVRANLKLRLAEEKVFDTRLIPRNQRVGLLTADKLDQHLKKLPDLEERAEAIRVPLPGSRRKAQG